MDKIIGNALNKILYTDKYSKNNTICPHCGSDKLMTIGHNKLRGEDTIHCTSCGKKHKQNNY